MAILGYAGVVESVATLGLLKFLANLAMLVLYQIPQLDDYKE